MINEVQNCDYEQIAFLFGIIENLQYQNTDWLRELVTRFDAGYLTGDNEYTVKPFDLLNNL